jgi:hypothetical protein
MLSIWTRGAPLCLLALLASGCLDFSFGSDSTEVTGCSVATPHSVARDLESRYALGSHTTLYLSDLDNPQVASSDPEIVAVGPIEGDETDGDMLVELSFVGIGTAVLTISEAGESIPADVPIEVAAFERFEVVLPTAFHHDPVVPLAGKAVIDPALEVIYYDRDGRLYGRGLAQTKWTPDEDLPGDAFFNDTLDHGPHQVEVRADYRASVIPFAAVARNEVVALELLETRLDENLIRLELVGLTESGTQVWNIDPILSPEGGDLYLGSFEYVHDPDARPIELTAMSFAGSPVGALDPIETTFQGEPTREGSSFFSFASVGGRAPVMALSSLLLMTLSLQLGIRRRSPGSD